MRLTFVGLLASSLALMACSQTPAPTSTPRPSVSATPTPQPTMSPSPSITPQPSATPQDVRLDASTNTVLNQGAHVIDGALKLVALDRSGQGLILWNVLSPDNQFRTVGKRVSQFALGSDVSYPLERFDKDVHLALNAAGNGVLVWNSFLATSPDVDPQILYAAQLTNFQASPQTTPQANYHPHSVSLDSQGKGWLLTSDERPFYRSPENQHLNTDNTTVFAFPVQNGQVQSIPQQILVLPLRNAGQELVKGGFIDTAGSGFVVWTDPTAQRYRMRTFTGLAPTGDSVDLTSSLTDFSDLEVQVHQGEGQIFWYQGRQGEATRVFVRPVSNGRPSETTREVVIEEGGNSFLSNQNSSFQVRTWDVQMFADGRGMMAWLQYNAQGQPQAVKVRTLQNYQPTRATTTITWPANQAVPMVRLALSPDGQGWLVGEEARCSPDVGRCQQTFSRPDIQAIWARPISNFSVR